MHMGSLWTHDPNLRWYLWATHFPEIILFLSLSQTANTPSSLLDFSWWPSIYFISLKQTWSNQKRTFEWPSMKSGAFWWLSWWRIHLPCRKPWCDSWVGKIRCRRDRLLTPVFLGFPGGSVGKESACNVGDLGLFPGLGRSPGKLKNYPLQYSGLKNSMDCIVHGVQRVRHNWATFTFHEINQSTHTHILCLFSC